MPLLRWNWPCSKCTGEDFCVGPTEKMLLEGRGIADGIHREHVAYVQRANVCLCMCVVLLNENMGFNMCPAFGRLGGAG